MTNRLAHMDFRVACEALKLQEASARTLNLLGSEIHMVPLLRCSTTFPFDQHLEESTHSKPAAPVE